MFFSHWHLSWDTNHQNPVELGSSQLLCSTRKSVFCPLSHLYLSRDTNSKKSYCFNFFCHAPQESCLFCAHCHILPGDFETGGRQDGPVFGLTSQSSTGGSHRLDRGGCLPDRWSSGFRNYGASEELWSLSSTTCWYFFTWLPHLPISHNHAKSAVVESFF